MNIDLLLSYLVSDVFSDRNVQKFRTISENHTNTLTSLSYPEYFSSLLSAMFESFQPVIKDKIPLFSEILSGHNNLDTGNSGHEPPPSFLEALTLDLQNPKRFNGYLGPKPIEKLGRLAGQYFVNNYSGAASKDLTVIVGAGTVNIYDSFLSSIIERPSDTLIVPTPTYGFFVPQIYRKGGLHISIAGDNVENSYKISPLQLERSIIKQNEFLIENWMKSAELKFKIFTNSYPRAETFEMSKGDLKKLSRKKITQTLKDYGEKLECSGARKNWFHQILPPRVVGLYFINPNIAGEIYNHKELADLSAICAKYQISIIEDLAYDKIRLEKCIPVFSFQEFHEDCFTLLGISKPFSLAEFRLGLGVCPTSKSEQVYRNLEGVIGFVPSLFQEALATMLDCPQIDLEEYFESTNFNQENGYSTKRNLIAKLAFPVSSNNLSSTKLKKAHEIIMHFLRNIEDQLSSSNIDNYLNVSLASSKFFKEGLENWFEIRVLPESGFFLIIECEKLLRSEIGTYFNLKSSYDVFLFLSFFSGIRTIPGEAMGVSCSTVLRVSFSMNQTRIIQSIFFIWCTLTAAEFKIKNTKSPLQ